MSHEIPNDVTALTVSEDDLRTTPKPVVVNVVSTFDLSNPTIDTERLTMRLPGIGFNPQKFAAAKMRFQREMALAFCGGRAVCPGARSVMASRIAAVRFAELQLRAGEYVQYRKFRVQNIVMSVWSDFEVELSSIRAEYSALTEYKASKFPGLSFRIGNSEHRMVFNIFVTGRVVITGSKNVEHSYKGWWWLYTHVLQRHRRQEAPGTTSSAAYRMSTHRRLDTLASDCENISSRHVRRENGPMAKSAYGDFLAVTPRSVHVPTTPRSVMNDTLHGVALYFDRMTRFFGGHKSTCPYVVADESMAPRLWFDEYRVIVQHLEYPGVDIAALLKPHIDVGCVSSSVLHYTKNAHELLRRYQEQLAAAIGLRTMNLIGVDGPFHGHTLTCPLIVRVDEWRTTRETLEIALAGVEEYNCATLLAPHDHADCSINGDTVEDRVKLLIAQLHMACHDFDDDPETDVDMSVVEFEPFTMDDAHDYEALYRLDVIRKRPFVSAGSFSL